MPTTYRFHEDTTNNINYLVKDGAGGSPDFIITLTATTICQSDANHQGGEAISEADYLAYMEQITDYFIGGSRPVIQPH